MISLRRYTVEDEAQWDAFSRNAKNSTFLFQRAYMDYHRDRFQDHSLLFFNEKGRLLALLPANEALDEGGQHILASHQGLTYGGLILSAHSTVEEVMQLMTCLVDYASEQGFDYILYKALPIIYHRLPSQEDLYALFRHKAELVGCNISCTVALQSQPPIAMERRRRRGVERARSLGYQTEPGTLAEFWPVMEENLMTRYHARPVHSLPEMQYLQERFPEQIQCTVCRDARGELQAGVVAFLTGQTVHVQYGHATPCGRTDGALDYLYASLMDYHRKAGVLYFDYGTSNEQNGQILNESLIAQKEGFGGRGIVYPMFKVKRFKG